MRCSRMAALPNRPCSHHRADLAGLWSSPYAPGPLLGISMFSAHRWAPAGVLAKEHLLPLKRKRGKRLCANKRRHCILDHKWKLRCAGYGKKDIYIILFWIREYYKQNPQWLTGLPFHLILVRKKWASVRAGQPPSPPSLLLGLSSQVDGVPRGADTSFTDSEEDDWASLLLVAALFKVSLWEEDTK